MNGLGWKTWGGAVVASLVVHAGVVVGVRLPADGKQDGTAGPEVSVAGSLQGLLGGAVGGVPVTPVEAREVALRAAQSVTPLPREFREGGPVRPRRAAVVQPRRANGVVIASAAPVVPRVVSRPSAQAADPGADVRAKAVLPVPPVPAVKPVRPVEAKRSQSVVRGREKSPDKARSSRKARQPGSASRAGSKRQGAGGVARRGGRRASGAGAGAVRSYGARVRARILANRPPGGGVGRTVVTFGVSGAGGLRFVRLARSSGDSSLDRAAVAAVRRSQPFPRPPKGATGGQLTFSISFNFR